MQIDIEARLAKFQDGLDAVSRDVNRAVGGLERTFARLGAGIAGLVAGAGVGSLGAAFKATVDQLDAFNDASDKTGASVEELSSLLNTLSPYGGTLEQITDVAGLLTKAMRGAEEETSKAAGAFKALGVETRDSAGNFRPIQDVLEDVAKSLNQYADGTNKTALAQDILGKGAAQYMPLLKDLANAQRANATTTTEQAAAAEKFNVELGKLSRGIDTLKIELTGPLLTALSAIVERFNAAGTSAENFYNRLRLALQPNREIARLESDVAALTKELTDLGKLKVLPEFEADRVAQIATVTERLAKARKALADAGPVQSILQRDDPALRAREDRGFDPTRIAAPLNAASGPATKQQLSDGERLLKQLQDRVFATLQLTEVEKLQADIARGAIKFDTERQQNAAIAAAKQIDSIKQITEAAEAESKAAIERIRRFEELDAAQSRFNEDAEKAIRDQIQAWEDLADPTLRYQRELERINELLEQGRITSEQANRFRSAVVGGLLGDLEDRTKEVDNFARDLGLTFQSAFEDAVIEGEKLSKVLQSLAKDVARVFLRETITKPLLGAVTSGLGGLFGGGGASGPDQLSGPLGNIGASLFSATTKGGGGGVVNNFDFRNSAMTEGVIVAAVTRAQATTRASIYDDQVRGREVPA